LSSTTALRRWCFCFLGNERKNIKL
jgi:hypothetical protein